jgi:hypothetical protein
METTDTKPKADVIPSALQFDLFGQSYTVEFPTNGQINRIERMKIALSGGNYVGFYRTDDPGYAAKLSIDAAAFMDGMLPDLSRTLNIKGGWDELPPAMHRELIQVYQTKIYKWYTSCTSFLLKWD